MINVFLFTDCCHDLRRVADVVLIYSKRVYGRRPLVDGQILRRARPAFSNEHNIVTDMKSDEEIRKHVMEEILDDPQLTKIASQIGVTVKDQVVTLSGIVDYYGQKIAAEKAAERVRDVKVVAMDINVNSAGAADSFTDSAIAYVVRQALRWHSSVNDDEINIKVEDGWVYLEGEVDWAFERNAAQQVVEHLRGVKGVFNSVTIRKKGVDAAEIKKKIKAAFHRHATVDSGNVKVSATGGTVILTGTVRSLAERRDAESVAWSMPGVSDVENHLDIENSILVGD